MNGTKNSRDNTKRYDLDEYSFFSIGHQLAKGLINQEI
jgi:hypothetical protein